jgi:soluble lytic murein transglycosylase-like protein
MGSESGQGPMARAFHGSLAFACLVLAASQAHTQVLEIGDGGAVTVHDRPEMISSTGTIAILPATRRSTSTTPSAVRGVELSDAATAADLSPEIVEAVAWRESRLRAGLISKAGAIGEMQLMPGTAHDLGVDPFDSRQNFAGGAAYLGGLLKRYKGDVVLALAAYNAGPGAVDRYGGVPPYKETQDYVAAILDRLSQRAEAQAER